MPDRRREGEDHSEDAVNREIDNFSISVLRYDRRSPGRDRRTPGEIIEEVEERLQISKTRRASTRKWLGALLLSVGTAILMAVLTSGWPWLLKLFGGGAGK